MEGDEYHFFDEDDPHTADIDFDDGAVPQISRKMSNESHGSYYNSELQFKSHMNKDYHMHEQLLPQTIIKIVKAMSPFSPYAPTTGGGVVDNANLYDDENGNGQNVSNNDNNGITTETPRGMKYQFTEDGFIKCPCEFQYETVAMFIDVSGFTKMTELLDAEGPWGGEKVAFYLNRYLEQVARIVASEGGDIFKFAGDAMIIIWPWNEDTGEAKTEQEKENHQKEIMGRAIQCGLNIQKALHDTQFASGVSLSVKIGIGFGLCKIVFVGGTLDRCEYLACGEPLSQAFTCENNATPGDVIVYRSLERAVDRKYFQLEWIEDSNCFKVQKQHKKIRTKRKKGNKRKKDKYEFVDEETVKRLNQFIPQAAKTRLLHRYRRWHQESRMMTVIFINLDFKEFDKLPIAILQEMVATMQVALYRYEGSLNKFTYDDKGATAVAVFGLPPMCNFDDAARGVYAALEIEKVLKSLKGITPIQPQHVVQSEKLKEQISQFEQLEFPDLSHSGDRDHSPLPPLKLRKVSIGVTCGRVYCGLLGSGGSGCEYGVLGDLVNLSARLMQHAGKPKEKGGLGEDEGGVLVSKEIKIQCDDARNLQFEKLKPIQVKGKSNHIEVYRPEYKKVEGETIIYRSRYNIGFQREYDQIEEKIKQMIGQKGEARGTIICVEGHHWYGCTHFAREVMARLRKHIYIVGASAIKFEETQLVVWQALMARMTRECHLLHGDDEGFKDSVTRFFMDTGLEALLPDLWIANEVLGTKFEVDPAKAAEIQPEFKMEFMTKIVLHFLRSVSRYAPLLLVVVKHQFMSKDDWFLTHAVCKKIKSGELRNVSFLIAGWPQRNKAYSNRYCHCDAALGYKAFREEFCTETANTVVSPEDPDMLDIITTPLANKVDNDTESFVHSTSSRVITIEIGRWSKSEVEDFLRIEFDIKRCSPQLVKFVHNKTGGIPAMCKALVRDHHLVFVKNGGNLDCSSIERLGDLALGFKETDINFPIPASIQSYFTKMMDALNDHPNSQFILITLKTATLICTGQEFQSLAFALDTLRACHPLFNTMDEYFNADFEEAIEVLTKEGFIREGSFEEERQQYSQFTRAPMNKNKGNPRTPMNNGRPSFYVFCSGFARDVIYNVMLFKQRSELHRQVIVELERYDELLEAANLQNSELRNALCRHQRMQLFDGMKSNFEIEAETLMMDSPMKGHQMKRDETLQNSRAMDFFPSIQGAESSKPHFHQNQGAVPGQSIASGVGRDSALDGDLHLSTDDLDYEPRPSVRATTRVPPCVLVIFLKTAKNIPRLDLWQIPNIYVSFHFGHGKTKQLSRSKTTSNSDEDDDPVWNEYAAIPLSRELLRQETEQKIIIKFWDDDPINRPNDDQMIGKAMVDLVDLYEEQIKQHRHLENKLQTPRNSMAAMNFHHGLKKQLEDRDYIFVEKTLKMSVEDCHKKKVNDSKQPSTFEAMFKFCVLQNVSNSTAQEEAQRNAAAADGDLDGGRSVGLRMSEITERMLPYGRFSEISEANSLHESEHSEDIRAHMPVMSHMHGGLGGMGTSRAMLSMGGDSFMRNMAHHEDQSTGMSSYITPTPLKMTQDYTATSNAAHSVVGSLHTNTPVRGHTETDIIHFDAVTGTAANLLNHDSPANNDDFMRQLEDEEEIDFNKSMQFVHET